MRSKALEVNIADYHVEVAVDPKYAVLQKIMSEYYGLKKGLDTFLQELSHPYKNWDFIISEARRYSLEYFHLLKSHKEGPKGAEIFLDIFLNAVEAVVKAEQKTNAANNYLLYIQKIFSDAGNEIKRFMPVLETSFNRILSCSDPYFFLFVKSYYQLNRLCEILLNNSTGIDKMNFKFLNLLLIRYYRHTYTYWLNEEDPQKWFEKECGEVVVNDSLKATFDMISHANIKKWAGEVEKMAQKGANGDREILLILVRRPGFRQFVDTYREIPRMLYEKAGKKSKGVQRELIFLFLIMNTSGLSIIHDEALREINRTLSWIIENEDLRKVRNLIQKTFSILKEQTSKYPATALNCVENMGRGIYKTNDLDLVHYFLRSVIDLGFQSPMIQGVGNDWQVRVNISHLRNIRTWLSLIEQHPKLSTRLLSTLIIYLSVCGVYIKDTDLFPRDITRLLNSDIEPVYNLVKQLSRIFPAFFNDIGAEGKLRDTSTELDELTRRKDPLVHFLRKQSHVESSNRILGFMESVVEYWRTRDKSVLSPYLPPDIYRKIETSGVYVDGINRLFSGLKEKGLDLDAEKMLLVDEHDLKKKMDAIDDVSETDKKRVLLFIAFNKLLNQKYNLNFVQMESMISDLRREAFPDLEFFEVALKETDLKKRIHGLLDYLEDLKCLIISDKTYEIKEDIYQKRHFTVDIPSMYGSYHELKFDALGLSFRIESIVNTLFEEFIETIDLSIITKATFFQIYDRLILFDKALKLEGVSSIEFERQLDLLAHSLEVREFSFTQYLDIFKGFALAVKNIINFNINKLHEENLNQVLSQVVYNQVLPRYRIGDDTLDTEKRKYRVSEIFYRDIIAKSLGLQQLDVFLSRVLNTLFYQSDKLHRERLHMLLNYDPKRAMIGIDNADTRISGIIFLGNKGNNLVRLKKFNLPVPPGFIITTEVFRCKELIDNYRPAEQNFKEQLARQLGSLEKTTGKFFGNPLKPLLLSVRSGSSISQPGMLDTYLNVGISEDIAAAIGKSRDNPWFAWDNYRRFLQSYGMSFGLKRDDFDEIINAFKKKQGIPFKRGFSGTQMREVALSYKTFISDSGIEIVEKPFDQIYMIIKKVLNSWDSPKAKVYRKIMGISDDWGTAVTVQAMVYGNLSRRSGSGVFFTHSPRSGDILRLWGDFSLQNQGEDVVSGLVQTLPISLMQKEIENRDTDITLETHFPEIFNALKDWSNELVFRRGWGPQEMEFTFEDAFRKDLYLLQTRDMSLIKGDKVKKFDFDSMSQGSAGVLINTLLGHGIGISGGAMSGRVVFTLAEIESWRKKEPDTHLILVRNDTVPDDIQEIYASDGLLTSRGGVTSHASIVATRLQKTCVVGCTNFVCNESDETCLFGDVEIRTGGFISIDGQEGSIYLGKMKIKDE
ncbi:MAG: pyruvate, phosphate dikinase [Proteobacteria bacterium]|nr:pyruvate, phosphate dikinase [Pseudomonadota bacterium]